MLSREELIGMGFAYIGKDVRVYEKTVFVNRENIHLGDGCEVDDFVFVVGSNLIKIGNRVHIASFVSLIGGGEITIDDCCGISVGGRLISGTDDFLGSGLVGPCVPPEFRSVQRSFVHLEKHVLLGTNTIVHPGVTIHEGAVTGSGTVVTKDLEAWGVYIGAPAKRVKDRPRDKILRYEKEMIRKYGY